MKIDMTEVTAILQKAGVVLMEYNADTERQLARAKWKPQMRYPRAKPKLTLVR